MSTAFAAFVAGSLRSERFTLLDIGCSGGMDPAWRVFGDRLRAVGLDASVDECERLRRAEIHPDVEYVAAFVGLPPDHSFARKAAGKPRHVRDPFPRFSAWRARELKRESLHTAPLEEKLENNVWDMTRLAPADKPVAIIDLLQERGWLDLDFVKIDIDGPDYEVLNSFDGHFDALALLAARLEVNLAGGAGETEHMFHNTDRFMRKHGFELLALEVRNYSMSALPSPFAITTPAQTVTGRPFQADAYYARDPAAVTPDDFAAAMTAEKMAKLAAIFSVWNQPDSAAELLVRYRGRLQAVFDVDAGLDLLAGQAQPDGRPALSYEEYVALFESGSARFYPPAEKPPVKPAVRDRLGAAWKAFFNPG